MTPEPEPRGTVPDGGRGPGPWVGRVLRALLASSLLVLAWIALSGAWRQLSRDLTLGQRVETWVQIACGALTLGMVVACFRRPAGTRGVERGWAVSLVGTAALSGLVWGPPMPHVAALFGALALLVALGVIRACRALRPPGL